MNLLVAGSGGREHALAWKLSQSPQVEAVYCAPGNGGTAAFAKNLPVPAGDIAGMVRAAREVRAGLVVIGPDDALAAGMADALAAAGLRAFGPTAAAARLESSKSFAKDFMRRHGIPCAESEAFDDPAAAIAYCRGGRFPVVVKADGLALGKGVVIAEDFAAARQAIEEAMVAGKFGLSGRRVVIEEFLEGRECSIHALVDGSGWLAFPDARDHKRALDGDRGPNTGGMGTISPSGVLDEPLWRRVREEILDRFVAGSRADGLEYRGMLFPGLMITASGPKVLEFNCRFGDPETQVLLRRLDSDLLDLLLACTEDRVNRESPAWSSDHAACVVMASAGYPGPVRTGLLISGIEDAEAVPGLVVFHAGTRRENGRLLTSGGRVLGVTARAAARAAAIELAYQAVRKISFEGAQFRGDIGA
ncbi:MAG: phosphoribosylamine--glycine ligase [Terrimicrobiaceae bacterium]|nr:phosphoribosylamine--glycine ligase [Terrimicrobiaceae bacterium]